MLEFQEKRKLRRLIYSKITLVLLILLILLILNGVWNIYKKQDITKDNLAKTASSLESLQARENMLSSQIERLKTPAGTEEEIREKYGLVKPGEEVIVVVDSSTTAADETSTTDTGFWQKIVNWFQD